MGAAVVRPNGHISRGQSKIDTPPDAGRVAQNTDLSVNSVLKIGPGTEPSTVNFRSARIRGIGELRTRDDKLVIMVADSDGDWLDIRDPGP